MTQIPQTWDDIEQLYQNGVFCPEAWTSLSSTPTGKWAMCCYSEPIGGTAFDTSMIDHMNHQDRRDVRLAMLTGDQSRLKSICGKCHYQQDHGIASRRDRMMDHWRKHNDHRDGILRSVKTTTQQGKIDIPYIYMMDIKFAGNQCNLRCIMCSPDYSSAIGVEAKQMGELPADYKPVQVVIDQLPTEMTDTFWYQFRKLLPKVQILNFTGGEPFMMNAYWLMIDMAIQLEVADQIELHLSSNMTNIKWNGRSVLDYFKYFKRVRLQCSIDGYGEFNNYIRYPSEFQTILDNIKMVQDRHTNVDIVASTVVSALSVSSLPRLNQHMQDQDITHTYHNVLAYPVYQRVEWLPEGVKHKYLTEVYQDQGEAFSDVVGLLQQPENRDHHQTLINRCRALDKHRGTDARLLWPEFIW